ncbi:MAG: T9SS type A sorting domain-containing protein, partial [Bacteroidota bacterium]
RVLVFFTFTLVLVMVVITVNAQELHQIFHYHGETSNSDVGYYSLKSLGDINYDGFDDVAFSSGDPKGIFVFLGGNPVDSFPDYFFPNAEIMGDFLDYDGDGEPELVASWDFALYIYQSYGGILDTTPSDTFPIPEGYVHYTLMETGYLDNDSIADVLIRIQDPYEGHRLYLYYNMFSIDTIADWSFIIDFYSHSINTAGFIDFNGDSILDIFVPRTGDLDTLGFINLYYGPDFGNDPDLIIGHPLEFEALEKEWFSQYTCNLGDVNGDLHDDLGVASYNAGNHALVYLGGPIADTIYDYWLDGGCQRMSGAGDVNGDGFGDVVIGGANAAYGSVILYFGGPDIDTIRDGYINREDLPPLFLDNIGRNVSSAGDFNGDGNDDILFKCSNFSGSNGDVFIHSGGDDVLGLEDETNEIVTPMDFQLQQNYPNPFNSNTTINFSLKKRGYVNMEIYNVVGQKVITCIDNHLYFKGDHFYLWDGNNSMGETVASGVYFYRLSIGGSSEIKSMVLLK